MANNESSNFLMINRIGYIYLRDSKGQGHIRSGDEIINDKSIKEVILFFLFDYNLAYNKSDKKDIINNLKLFDYNLAYNKSDKKDIINNLKEFKKGARNIKLADLRSNFPPYNHLLKQLIKDKYVEKKDKLFLLSLKHDIKY